jgi:hypothetical protein
MPEPYWPKKKGAYLLADAEQNARYARIWCSYCKASRYFVLAELRAVFGNIECDDVVYQGWRCEGCGGKGQLQIRVEDPPAGGGVTIRRLRRIDTVRRPVWRDEAF